MSRSLIDIPFRSSDGLESHGYLALPPIENPPCVIELPAGIRSSAKETSSGQESFYDHLDDFLNCQGFAVFHIDRRGCYGYGNGFVSRKDYGGLDVQDIICGTRTVIDSGLINSERLGMYGTCSSCIPALFAMDGSHLYKCGLLVSGFFDITAQADFEFKKGTRQTPTLNVLGVKKLDDFPHRERSPINCNLKIDVPLFMYHGADDDMSPVEHSRRMYKKFREDGVDVRYQEVEKFPHLRSSSDPTTEIGSGFWNATLKFLSQFL